MQEIPGGELQARPQGFYAPGSIDLSRQTDQSKELLPMRGKVVFRGQGGDRKCPENDDIEWLLVSYANATNPFAGMVTAAEEGSPCIGGPDA